MRTVTMRYIEMPRGLHICFVEDGDRLVGRHRMYPDVDRIYDILRAAQAPLADHQAVAEALRLRRPGGVELRLTEEQYERLTSS